MKRANAIDTHRTESTKDSTKRDQVRTVAPPKATAAQEMKVKVIRDWENRTERMLFAGDRARS